MCKRCGDLYLLEPELAKRQLQREESAFVKIMVKPVSPYESEYREARDRVNQATIYYMEVCRRWSLTAESI